MTRQYVQQASGVGSGGLASWIGGREALGSGRGNRGLKAPGGWVPEAAGEGFGGWKDSQADEIFRAGADCLGSEKNTYLRIQVRGAKKSIGDLGTPGLGLGDLGESGVPDQRLNERIRLGKESCEGQSPAIQE